jgi:poly(3-hydroxybutyrate) depolymerase
MKRSIFKHKLAYLLMLALPYSMSYAASPLPALGTDPAQNTVSGLSSGAFMATQFAVAYSAGIAGAGIIAGGPFYCAGLGGLAGPEHFLITATTLCMQPLGAAPSGAAAWQQAQQFAKQGDIDPTRSIAQQRIYIFTGSADNIVKSKVVAQTAAFYRAAGVKEPELKYVDNINAGHALLTANSNDLACAANAPPNINNCGFTQSQDVLRQMYGNLKPSVSKLGGQWIDFDQSEFATANSGMSSIGHAYIPSSCFKANCRVHVVFHGCTQEDNRIGDRFYRSTGYNELAESNRIVMLYPQIRTDKARNPQGCWDFWGYSSKDPARPDFYTKKAPQMAAVWAMLLRLNQIRPK